MITTVLFDLDGTLLPFEQDDFVKIEVKELPQAVQDAIAKSYEGSTVKEAYVAGADGAKKYKVVLVDKDQKEQTVVLNEKGEVIE